MEFEERRQEEAGTAEQRLLLEAREMEWGQEFEQGFDVADHDDDAGGGPKPPGSGN